MTSLSVIGRCSPSSNTQIAAQLTAKEYYSQQKWVDLHKQAKSLNLPGIILAVAVCLSKKTVSYSIYEAAAFKCYNSPDNNLELIDPATKTKIVAVHYFFCPSFRIINKRRIPVDFSTDKLMPLPAAVSVAIGAQKIKTNLHELMIECCKPVLLPEFRLNRMLVHAKALSVLKQLTVGSKIGKLDLEKYIKLWENVVHSAIALHS